MESNEMATEHKTQRILTTHIAPQNTQYKDQNFWSLKNVSAHRSNQLTTKICFHLLQSALTITAVVSTKLLLKKK